MRTFTRLFVLAILFSISGCGLFSDDGDPFDIEITESIPVTFEIDSAKLCPPGEDCTDPNGAPVQLTPPEFEFSFPLDILTATGSPELKEVASRLKRVEIESVDYEYVDNTLNSPGPRVVMFLGGANATDHSSAGVVEIADIPGATAMTNESGSSVVDDAKKEIASDHFKSLNITAIPLMRPAQIEPGQPWPTGKATINLTMNLKFVANPTEL